MPTGNSESPDDAGRYGRLASRFHASLAAARAALSPHAGLLPAGRLARFDALIGDFERRRVRIAVYGEVKAGKSTLVNAIAGTPLSPSSFGPLTSVPIRITFGEQTTWSAGGEVFASADALAEAMRSDIAVDEVAVTTALDLLQLGGQVDLVDTPGVGSDDRFDMISAQVLARLDAVVLVVRYPALFTRFTRHLMQQLESEIGKLFVVWNLDAACTGLPAEELEHQVDALRRNVAGIHDLFTVDAQRALQAAQDGDADGLAASGLPHFVEGIRSFASSDRRAAISLRETAKRVEKWLRQADEALTKRRSKLEGSIAETRRQLDAIQSDADAHIAAAREAFAGFQKAVAEIAAADADQATKGALAYRKQLRKARRRWFRNGDAAALGEAIRTASEAYADGVDAQLIATTNALHAAAQEFGTVVSAAPRERIVPSVASLAPEDRLARAGDGRLRGVRRRLWRGWYLPGFDALWRGAVDAEIGARADWRNNAARTAEGAGQATLDARVVETEQRAARTSELLRQERRLVAEEQELAAIERDGPVVRENRARIAELAAAAADSGRQSTTSVP